MIDLAEIDTSPLGTALSCLKRITEFETHSLVRQDDLGAKGAFHAAVEPAQRLQLLFSRLPVEALSEFPENELTQVTNSANNIYKIFEQIMEFDPDQGEPASRRDELINTLGSQYQPMFVKLMPYISYGVARTVDWAELASDGRAAVQSVRDQVDDVVKELGKTSDEAKTILKDVRDAAAEQGVTQQAKYFEAEAKIHANKSNNWKVGTFFMAFIVTLYAVATLFFPTVELFQASTTAEAIQLTVSKVLVFFVLVSVLLLCVRNFSAHQHNSIVNKHRQNALMTFTTLAEAGHSQDARDSVLQHAAAAIYAPNDTGYVKHEERGYSAGIPISVSSPRGLGSGSAANVDS